MIFNKILHEIEEKYEAKLLLDKVSLFKHEKKLLIEIIKLNEDNIKFIENDIKNKLEIYEYDISFIFITIDDLFLSLKEKIGFIEYKINSKKVDIFVFDESQIRYLNNQDIFNSTLEKLKYFDINIEIKIKNLNNEIEIEKIEQKRNEELKNDIKLAVQVSEKTMKTTVSEFEKTNFNYGFIKEVPKDFSNISDLQTDTSKVKLKGKIYEIDKVKVRTGYFIKFDLDDGHYAITCKFFVREELIEKFSVGFRNSMGAIVSGIYKYDEFERGNVLNVTSIEEIILPEKEDIAEEKRIEFNIHTKYTALESVVGISDLISRLKSYGHKSFGITDLFNVQAYPEIYKKAKSADIKVNLGLQTNIIEDGISILTNYYNIDIKNKDFVVFDIETTGLSNFTDKIIEFGAVKISDGKIVDIFEEFVNPKESLSEFTTSLTGITNEMVANKDTIDEVMPRFISFIKDSVLVAHNAEFDVEFIIEKANILGIEFKPVYIDTLYLARALNPELKNHRLNTLTKEYKVNLLNHHRASDDARATAELFLKMIDKLKDRGIEIDNDINSIKTDWPKGNTKEYQNIFYVRNKIGLKNLYKIVSDSNIKYFNREPNIPYKFVDKNREGLLVGTGNYKSKLFKLTSLKYPIEILSQELSRYDFITIVPTSFSNHLINRGYIRNVEHLIEINKTLINLAIEQNKLYIAIGDVYYLDKKDYSFRNVLKNFPRKTSIETSGEFYFRTTNEMMGEFDYLDEDIKRKLVIENTHLLDDLIENISPIADGTFPPKIKDAEKILSDDSYNTAKTIYGENLPDIVKSRLDRELNSIISNGYAALYMIAKKLVKKSNEDGYLVGSRGSVGSSFAATMAEITEVNPLPPHYICPNCKNYDFDVNPKYKCGPDLPVANCPKCNTEYIREGFDIPFEVFLGFEGDKEPDIDLNFASVYQSKIHKYTEYLFGSDKVFRAGTLGTIADKTAFQMARKYKEMYPDDNYIKTDTPNLNKVKRSITEVKRSTGQHAGGLIIVPDDKEIEDFTPIQYPADKKDSGVITTHFDYHAIDKNLLKLDLLGHNAPTIIRLLSDMSGIDAVKVDLSDKKTMSIFSGTEALNIKHDYSNKSEGSLGIPEFGTPFVRGMLIDTKPTTFEELIRISGLSHGTDVWLNNAQDLVKSGIELKDTICTRDDIMNYLISMDLKPKLAFDIMENVRKGKGLSESDIAEMKSKNIPDWYIDSCQKIQYMFPKAHAVAYVMMSYRIAYFKVHHPEYFYAVTFTSSISSFKLEHTLHGLEYLTTYLKKLKTEEFLDNSTKDQIPVLELVEEMYAREIYFEKVDLYKSHPTQFTVIELGKILPPLMSIDNVSESIAFSIEESRKDGEFISIEDFKKRVKINKTALESVRDLGILNDLQETNQIDFLSF